VARRPVASSAELIAGAQVLADKVSGQPGNVDAGLPELAALLHGSDEPDVLIAVTLAPGEAWD
jgi:hypothetical protein